MLSGAVRILDSKDRIVVSRRFDEKHRLKKVIREFRLLFWESLESGDKVMSILMDVENGFQDQIDTEIKKIALKIKHKKPLKENGYSHRF